MTSEMHPDRPYLTVGDRVSFGGAKWTVDSVDPQQGFDWLTLVHDRTKIHAEVNYPGPESPPALTIETSGEEMEIERFTGPPAHWEEGGERWLGAVEELQDEVQRYYEEIGERLPEEVHEHVSVKFGTAIEGVVITARQDEDAPAMFVESSRRKVRPISRVRDVMVDAIQSADRHMETIDPHHTGDENRLQVRAPIRDNFEERFEGQ